MESGETVTTKEAIYDEKFSPLVTQLIALAKEHDIPMLAQFQLNDERPASDADGDNPGFFCTTSILPANSAESMKKAHAVMKPPPPQVFAFTIVTNPK